MIKSMTGFGRCEAAEGDRRFTVEIKSVNHRYLDIGVKMPKKLSFFESSVRSLLKNYMQRGKADVFISYEDCGEADFSVKYNEDAAASYLGYLNQMAETFGLENDVKVSTLACCPEVFSMEEQSLDEKELWAILERALKGACDSFTESRLAEGECLEADLLDKLETLDGYVNRIEERSPEVLEEYRKCLEEKVRELLGDRQMDDARVLTEVALFADKACVDEETVRLKSHIKSMKDSLREGGSIGRKLDFIAQEMNREANTVLSKANDLVISDIGIDLKAEIEKIREQIQNIE